MTGVGKAIQIDELLDFGPVDNGLNDVAADKTGAAGDK
jgi:hypothetical protein